MTKSKKIYLALPYTHCKEKSFKAANIVAALLINKGHIVFSPISHSHPIAETGFVEDTHKVWLRQDLAFAKWADVFYLIVIDGLWGESQIKNSTGVQRELGWAKRMKKKVVRYYITFFPNGQIAVKEDHKTFSKFIK